MCVFATQSSYKASFQTIQRQERLVANVMTLMTDLRQSRLPRQKLISQLPDFIRNPKYNLHSFEPLAHPLDPTISVVGVDPDGSYIFKSAKQPLKLTFLREGGGTYCVRVRPAHFAGSPKGC